MLISRLFSVHTFRDFSAFNEATAKQIYRDWDQAVLDAVVKPSTPKERQQALHDLQQHDGFGLAHPREEHFVPIYVAAGAGNVESEDAVLLSGLYGCPTIAFGV